MHRSGFLARTAFFCNIAFLLCVALQRWAPANTSITVSFLAILGLVLGMCILNPLSNLVNCIAIVRRKPLQQWVPRWLAITNFCFLLFQIFYIIRIWL